MVTICSLEGLWICPFPWEKMFSQWPWILEREQCHQFSLKCPLNSLDQVIFQGEYFCFKYISMLNYYENCLPSSLLTSLPSLIPSPHFSPRSPSFFPSLQNIWNASLIFSSRCYVLLDYIAVIEHPERNKTPFQFKVHYLLYLDSYSFTVNNKNVLSINQNWLSYYSKSNSIL